MDKRRSQFAESSKAKAIAVLRVKETPLRLGRITTWLVVPTKSRMMCSNEGEKEKNVEEDVVLERTR